MAIAYVGRIRSDCECGESGEHSKRWQFWWEMMRDGSQRFCDGYRWCLSPCGSAAAVASGFSLDIYINSLPSSTEKLQDIGY